MPMTRARLAALVAYLLARAKEPGTIRQALNATAVAIGITLAPDRAEAIGLLGAAAAAVIGFFTEEAPPAPPPAGSHDA